VRHAFNKNGGNMGTEGSVAFMFKHCGQLMFAPGTDENAVMEAALEAGAEDVVTDEEGGIEVLTAPRFRGREGRLEAAGFKAEVAEIIMKPSTETVCRRGTPSRCRNCWTRWRTWTMCRSLYQRRDRRTHPEDF
jgi:transcriptional/translational regulatory protein YebC/TACO1